VTNSINILKTIIDSAAQFLNKVKIGPAAAVERRPSSGRE